MSRAGAVGALIPFLLVLGGCGQLSDDAEAAPADGAEISTASPLGLLCDAALVKQLRVTIFGGRHGEIEECRRIEKTTVVVSEVVIRDRPYTYIATSTAALSTLRSSKPDKGVWQFTRSPAPTPDALRVRHVDPQGNVMIFGGNVSGTYNLNTKDVSWTVRE